MRYLLCSYLYLSYQCYGQFYPNIDGSSVVHTPSATFTFIGAAGTGSATTPGSVWTTGSFDTSTANLLIGLCGWYSATTADCVTTDSKSNTYTSLTTYNGGGVLGNVKITYNIGGTVGSGHNLIGTAAAGFPCSVLLAFKSTGTPSFDAGKDTGANTGSGTTLSTGSLTPSVVNALVISALATDGGSTPYTINSSFSTPTVVNFSGGGNEGCGLSYIIQTSIVAKNPQWGWTTSATVNVALAVFKP